MPRGLVASDRRQLRTARIIGTAFDGIGHISTPHIFGVSVNVRECSADKQKRINFGLGLLLEELPIGGPIAEVLIGQWVFSQLLSKTGLDPWLPSLIYNRFRVVALVR
jgi:hypothetical protein